MAADLSQLERALVNADAAGDAGAARELAGEIRRLRGTLTQAPLQQSAYNPTESMSTADKFFAGVGKGMTDIARGTGQLFGLVDQSSIDEAKRLDAPLMNTRAGTVGNVAGNVATALPAAFIPGANAAVGATMIGGGMGALQPVATGESRLENTLWGAGAGLAGFGLGKLANKAVSAAAKRVGLIESKVAAKAAADAASETASARSAAGNAAQNAYRQLEHLRELKAMGLLGPEQKLIAEGLERELAEKAAEKLMPAAAQKETTAKVFKELTENETERAVKLAIDRLSNKEVKSQMMARLKRYGPAAVGGMIGNMIFPGLGGMVGGAATGLTLRPAIRSMFNLAKNPAVQHKLLSPIANSGLLGDPLAPQALGLLGPSIYAGQQ